MPQITPLLKQNNESFQKIIEPIPNPFERPFRWIISAGTQSGKTTALLNCLFKWWMVDNKTIWDQIFIFTSTAYQDDNWKLIADHEELSAITYLTDTLDESVINRIMELPHDDKHRLVIIDDMASDKNALDTASIHRLFMSGRHANLSIVITSQHYHNIPIILRYNASHFSIYRLQQAKTLSMVKTDLETNDVHDEMFDEIYDLCTKDKYQFLFIQLFPRKWYKSFEHEIKIRGKHEEKSYNNEITEAEEKKDALN
jgi:hypothetical protein